MSYTKHFSKVITVPYSGYVMTKEGSKSYSGTVSETVHVNIHVDTDDFDSSVSDCSQHVQLLTGSVAATNAAQSENIKSSSQRISQAIISGFFKTVRSELGQQIAQLKSQYEATLLHLNQMSKRCREKHTQMETDYRRLVERYSKIFTDLNKELEIRVFELDKAAFKAKETITANSNRTMTSDLAGTAAVTAGENARVQSSLLASVTKKRALDALHRAKAYLASQQRCRNLIDSALFNQNLDRRYYIPVCMAEGVDETNRSAGKTTLYKPDIVPNSARRRMLSELKKATWHPMPEHTRQLINKNFTSRMAMELTTDTPHDRRVKEYLNKFINNPLQSL